MRFDLTHGAHHWRADLANLVNEAALLAGRQNKIVVEKNDIIQAVERSIAVSYSVSWNVGGCMFSLSSCSLAGFWCVDHNVKLKILVL